jgi:transposase
MRRLRLREVREEEQAAVERLAHSRAAPGRQVERARSIWRAGQGETAPAIAAALRLTADTVRDWIKRFNAQGLAGLEDQPRAGRPPTDTPEPGATVIATSLSDPQSLDLPFASWPLDRLVACLNEQKGIAIKRSRIDEILRKEGRRWRKHATWFGERVDPAFAKKRGGSRLSTPPRRQAACSSASMRWGRSAPRASPARP